MSTDIAQLRTGGGISAIVPHSIEEVFRLATAIAKSGLAPNGIKTPEQITIAIMHGMELGLPPMQAVQRIAVVNGRPTIWGDAIPALLWSRGFRLREWDDDTTSFCEITRPDGTKITRMFSDADAKSAGLLGKSGPWTQYKRRMRQMRARGYAARDGAADVLGGLYVREELEDEKPFRDVTPKKILPGFDLPDIPDEAPAGDQAAVLREIEKALAGKPALEVEREYATAIMAMDEDGRAAAVEMIQEAKEPVAAE